jgi:GTP-binding protein EngB required for normal cell division
MRKASREAEEELLGSLHAGDNRPGQNKKQRVGNNGSSTTSSTRKRAPGGLATTPAARIVADNDHHEQHATAITSVLSRTLAFMDSESREKQVQRQVALKIRIVRDEIAFVTRKADKLAERYYNLKERSNTAMLDQLDVYDVEIANLENKLKDLQNSEVARRARAIESRLSIPQQEETNKTFNTSTSTTSVSGFMMPLGGVFETPPQRTTSPLTTVSNKPSRAEEEHVCLLLTTSNCIECQVIPTTHKCHRCKGLVCDLCCSTKRGLEMIWWCGNCFELESLTTQNLIRSGKYQSDDDDYSEGKD